MKKRERGRQKERHMHNYSPIDMPDNETDRQTTTTITTTTTTTTKEEDKPTTLFVTVS